LLIGKFTRTCLKLFCVWVKWRVILIVFVSIERRHTRKATLSLQFISPNWFVVLITKQCNISIATLYNLFVHLRWQFKLFKVVNQWKIIAGLLDFRNTTNIKSRKLPWNEYH
jgi:hypothetical protein